MGFVDTTPPNEWSVWKWIAIIAAFVMLISVHLEWEQWEWEWGGEDFEDETIGSEITGAAWLYTVIALMVLIIIFLGYTIEIDLPDGRMGINELLIVQLAFLTFLHSLGSIWRLLDYYENDVPSYFDGGPGIGLYLAFLASILLLVSGSLLWKQRRDAEWESTNMTERTSPPSVEPTPEPTRRPEPKPEPTPEPVPRPRSEPEPEPVTKPAPEPEAEPTEGDGLSKTAAFKKEIEKDDSLPPPPWIEREEGD